MIIEKIVNTLGFKELNPMQQQMLNCVAQNRILLAPTGAGKTLAYLLPVIRSIKNSNSSDSVKVLIISPSRELALQIDNVFRSTKSEIPISCVYGGHSVHAEKRSLEYKPTFVVGTPGRILDHLTHSNIDGLGVEMVIFDEFDKLLEMGFSDEMRNITELLPNVKERILTSATDVIEGTPFIDLTNFEKLNFLTGEASGELLIKKIRCEKDERLEKLVILLGEVGTEPTIIFCNFREQAEEVSDYLYDRYIESEYFHGGMEQFERERSLTKFRNRSVNILVSTDLASRGLDIPNIKHIIHYELPTNESAFVHRNGRTARVKESGTAYLMLTKDSYRNIEAEGGGALDWIDSLDGETMVLPQKGRDVSLPEWMTIYIGKGKKDKLSKVDIVGFLCQKGGITKDDIGLIELKDNHSFVAVRHELAKEVVKSVRDEKIKNIKTKIVLSF